MPPPACCVIRVQCVVAGQRRAVGQAPPEQAQEQRQHRPDRHDKSAARLAGCGAARDPGSRTPSVDAGRPGPAASQGHQPARPPATGRPADPAQSRRGFCRLRRWTSQAIQNTSRCSRAHGESASLLASAPGPRAGRAWRAERQAENAGEGEQEEAAQPAPAGRQARQEITGLDPVVRPGEQEDGHDREPQRHPAGQQRRPEGQGDGAGGKEARSVRVGPQENGVGRMARRDMSLPGFEPEAVLPLAFSTSSAAMAGLDRQRDRVALVHDFDRDRAMDPGLGRRLLFRSGGGNGGIRPGRLQCPATPGKSRARPAAALQAPVRLRTSQKPPSTTAPDRANPAITVRGDGRTGR